MLSQYFKCIKMQKQKREICVNHYNSVQSYLHKGKGKSKGKGKFHSKTGHEGPKRE
jgi:hypothetical protein